MYQFKLISARMGSFVLLLAFSLLPSVSEAATTPIAAKAVYVEGLVNAISVEDKLTRRVEVGDSFIEGDQVVTEADGVVEIEFDTGARIRLGKDTDMTIKTLKRDERGSTFSIFDLAIGRIKSLVSKLGAAGSKFEYHTKTAICGVSGSPPFVVEAFLNSTDVDFLGGEGEEGSLYVRGMDTAKTLITLFPHFRTTVHFGKAPLPSFKIDPVRFRRLNMIPFNSLKQVAPQIREQILMNSLSRKVSVPRQLRRGRSRSLEELEKQYDQGMGLSGSGRGREMGLTVPPFYIGKVEIQLN